jgi:hypothetical protein
VFACRELSSASIVMSKLGATSWVVLVMTLISVGGTVLFVAAIMGTALGYHGLMSTLNLASTLVITE